MANQTAELFTVSGPGWTDSGATAQPYEQFTGMDIVYGQTQMQQVAKDLEEKIRLLNENANVSESEKVITLQMLTNTWSTVLNMRTAMIKNVADVLKTVVRNFA